MLLLLLLIFWITMVGANYPSEALTALFSALDSKLRLMMSNAEMPGLFTAVTMDGLYKTVTWVIAVMLPPMAIFFPLFTLLEDAGYLPRIALQLDHAFCRAGACGKQSLSMCLRALRAQKTGPDEASDPVEDDIQISLPRVMIACSTNGINSVMSAA